MIRALVTGTLYGDPEARTSQAGKGFTTAKLKGDGKDGATVWCSLIAFGEAAERLATLKAGAALAVSGRAEVTAWLNQDAEPKGGLSLIIDELVTLKARPKPKAPTTRSAEPPRTTGIPFDDEVTFE